MPKRRIKTLQAVQANALQRIADLNRCIELMKRVTEGCSDQEMAEINAELDKIRSKMVPKVTRVVKWKPCPRSSNSGKKRPKK